MINIIKSGSTGNAVIYHNEIMVDCGVPYALIKPHNDNLKILLLTHSHGDHLNIKTIKALLNDRPSIQIAVPRHLIDNVKELPLENITIIKSNTVYAFSNYKICAFDLYHNVENVGYRIFDNETNTKILHATDTVTLDGIEAKGYDLYAIEFNYDAETIENVIVDKIAKGEYCYELDAVKNHLSFQKAQKFFDDNKKDTSQLVKLHVSKRYSKNEIISQ